MLITLEELAKHTSPEDLWISVRGVVYDISEFQFLHPGGYPLLRDYAGRDATEPFELISHLDSALQFLKPENVRGMLIGYHPPWRPRNGCMGPILLMSFIASVLLYYS